MIATDHPLAFEVDTEALEKLNANTTPQPVGNQRIYSEHTVNWKHLLKIRKEKIITPSERKQMEDFQRRYTELRAQLNSVGRDEPKKIIQGLRDKYHENPTAENFAKLRDAEGGIESMRQRFFDAKQAAKNRVQALHAEAAPLRKAVVQRVIDILVDEMAVLHGQEEVAAERLGIPYVPSASMGALQNAVHQLDNGFEGVGLMTSPLGDLASFLEE